LDLCCLCWDFSASPAPLKDYLYYTHISFVYISTPYSIRARELMQIYNTITMKFLTLDERLDILLTLKHTVKVCQLKTFSYE